MARWFRLLLLFVIGVPVLGFGIPLVWLWIASRFADFRVGIGYGPLAVLCLGMLATYLAVTVLADRLDGRERHEPVRRAAWMASLSSERKRATPTTSVERMFLTTVFVVGIVFEIWLIAFAHTSFL
ncbi:MAG: hypothetical protein QOG06_995 [Gaiellaceae bacterium]|nr:hypothetical protein [Gaiellaceae bacterium]